MPADQPFRAWFELRPVHGVDYADNLEPIGEVALTLNMPQMVAGGVLPTATQVCTIRPAEALSDDVLVRIIPGTRIIETSSMLCAQALYSRAEYQQLDDEPTQKQIAAAKDETAAHIDATEKRAEAVRLGIEHPADVNDPNPAPPVLAGGVAITGTVKHTFTADDRLVIDTAIGAGEIVNDEVLTDYVAKSTTADLLNDIGDNRLFALRVLIAEEARDEPRKGLIAKLSPIAEQTPQEG